MQHHEFGSDEVEFFVRLESEVWAALASGDAAVDESLLANDFLGVYGTGFRSKRDHIGQLESGPTVKAYMLSEARTIALCEEVVLLSYLVTWSRRGADATATPELTYISSVWRLHKGAWKNVFSQDTRADA